MKLLEKKLNYWEWKKNKEMNLSINCETTFKFNPPYTLPPIYHSIERIYWNIEVAFMKQTKKVKSTIAHEERDKITEIHKIVYIWSGNTNAGIIKCSGQCMFFFFSLDDWKNHAQETAHLSGKDSDCTLIGCWWI